MVSARYLLKWHGRDVRHSLMGDLSQEIRQEWEELEDYRRLPDFTSQIESTRNRVFNFFTHTQIERVIGLPSNNMDIEDIIENRKILLVNLQPSSVLSQENARVLGTLLINEIWQVMKKRKESPTGRPPSTFFVIIDEFQNFLTPDIPVMLPEGPKFGLRLLLFHQFLYQLRAKDEEIYEAVMATAQTKIVFGALRRSDARTMVEEVFTGLDLKRIKFLIEQTKFWPVHTRETVSSSGSIATSSTTWDPALEEAGMSASVLGDQESDADIPGIHYEPFKEVSSITPYTLEEILWQMSERLMVQYKRHYFVKLPGKKVVAAETPDVKPRHVSGETLQSYTDRCLAKFLTVEEVDRHLAEAEQNLLERARKHATEEAGSVERDDVWQSPKSTVDPSKG